MIWTLQLLIHPGRVPSHIPKNISKYLNFLYTLCMSAFSQEELSVQRKQQEFYLILATSGLIRASCAPQFLFSMCRTQTWPLAFPTPQTPLCSPTFSPSHSSSAQSLSLLGKLQNIPVVRKFKPSVPLTAERNNCWGAGLRCPSPCSIPGTRKGHFPPFLSSILPNQSFERISPGKKSFPGWMCLFPAQTSCQARDPNSRAMGIKSDKERICQVEIPKIPSFPLQRCSLRIFPALSAPGTWARRANSVSQALNIPGKNRGRTQPWSSSNISMLTQPRLASKGKGARKNTKKGQRQEKRNPGSGLWSHSLSCLHSSDVSLIPAGQSSELSLV